MKDPKLINIQTIQEMANKSEYKEAYIVLKKSKEYRIGVGARVTSLHQFSYFLEVLIYLCSDSSLVDLPLLEKKLAFLRELQTKKYSLSCQNDSCICCEIIIPPKDLVTEYNTIKSIVESLFKKDIPFNDQDS